MKYTSGFNPAPGYSYTVQKGDTLRSISLRAYGDESKPAWNAIYEANKNVVIGDDPNKIIMPGKVLSIPVSPYKYETSETPEPGYSYKVQQGDTLQSIAERAYGNGSQSAWNAIYNANRSVIERGPINLIGESPDWLLPGKILNIPPLEE